MFPPQPRQQPHFTISPVTKFFSNFSPLIFIVPLHSQFYFRVASPSQYFPASFPSPSRRPLSTLFPAHYIEVIHKIRDTFKGGRFPSAISLSVVKTYDQNITRRGGGIKIPEKCITYSVNRPISPYHLLYTLSLISQSAPLTLFTPRATFNPPYRLHPHLQIYSLSLNHFTETQKYLPSRESLILIYTCILICIFS